MPALVDQMAGEVSSAKTYAELIEARAAAKRLHSVAEMEAQKARAVRAHSDFVAIMRKVQGDCIILQKKAEMKLADEYDAAQERGEVHSAHSGAKRVGNANAFGLASAADLGLSRKEIHIARRIRDAEKAEPGLVERTVSAEAQRRYRRALH